MNIELNVNGSNHIIQGQEEDVPLLWVLRDSLGLVGTKYGCGGGFCGACTVLVDGQALRSCQVPAAYFEGKTITTIEGLANGDQLHPLQEAWIALDVPQCGYCQAGQIMNAAALLANNSELNDEDIDAAMAGNLCRCGCYGRIRQAIKRASQSVVVYHPESGKELPA